MINSELNNLFLDYTKEYITPTYREWSIVGDKYEELVSLLEDKNVFQSGSCSRFTAIRPINDLDVIWVISDKMSKLISSGDLNLEDILNDLAEKLEVEYRNIGIAVNIKKQSHSVGIYLGETENEFSIDIVPAKNTGEKNEFGDYILEIPEVLPSKEIVWKRTDPKGYQQEIKIRHNKNNNLRKVIRFIKKWRRNCKNNYPDFPLKSFHLELIVKNIFEENPEINFLDALELFYISLCSYINDPYFVDRANSNIFVDEYINEVSVFDKYECCELSSLALKRLDSIKSSYNRDNIKELIGLLLSAKDDGEKFIFDEDLGYRFVLDESLKFKINGRVLIENRKKSQPFSNYPLRENNCIVKIGSKIEFYISNDLGVDAVDYYWKVKNRGQYIINKEGNREPRGEISPNRTLHDPESAAYNGTHFVECYAIKDGKCLAYDRIYVYINK